MSTQILLENFPHGVYVMSSIKDELIALIKNLPDESSIDEIMYHLYVKQKILHSTAQLAAGQTHDNDKVKALARRWLK
jgi:hypothetical protein